MKSQSGKQRLIHVGQTCKVIISLALAVMMLCGNLAPVAPGLANALATEGEQVLPVVEPAPQAVSNEPVITISDPASVEGPKPVEEPAPQAESNEPVITISESALVEEPKPVEGEPKPVEGVQAPAEEPKPVEGEPAPVEEPKPVEGEPAPAEEPKPAEVVPAPAEVVPAPVEGEPAPEDTRSSLQRAIEDENGAYVDVQGGDIFADEEQTLLLGVLDSGLAFAVSYALYEDADDMVRVIFRTQGDEALSGYIPAWRATELNRQQTLDMLAENGVDFLFNRDPDLPLTVIGYTPDAEPEEPQEPAQPEEPQEFVPILEDMDPWVAAVTHNSVNLRKEPSVESALMAQLDQGTRITVRGQLIDAEGVLWYYVTYNLNPYYVMAEYVDVAESQEKPVEEPEEPTAPETPDETVEFAPAEFAGELPVGYTANGDGFFTYQTPDVPDAVAVLLVYGSVNGGEPAFYAVDENEAPVLDAPFDPAAPVAPAEPVAPETPAEATGFVSVDFAGDLPAGYAANGDGFYTYLPPDVPDAVQVLLVYGSVNGGEPAFYVVDENEAPVLDAPFDPAALVAPVEPAVDGEPEPFVQLAYEGEPVSGLTDNGDGYYTYQNPVDPAALPLLLVYGSANGGEPAFYAVNEDLVIDLTAPITLALIPVEAPAQEGEAEAFVFTPLVPDASLVPEYYQLYATVTVEEGEAEQPADPQPAPEQPAPEQPAPEQPAPEQPAPEQPAIVINDADPVPENQTSKTHGQSFVARIVDWFLPRASAEGAAAPEEATAPGVFTYHIVNPDGSTVAQYRIYGYVTMQSGKVVYGFFECNTAGVVTSSTPIDLNAENNALSDADQVRFFVEQLALLPTVEDITAKAALNTPEGDAEVAKAENMAGELNAMLNALMDKKTAQEDKDQLTADLLAAEPAGMANLTNLLAYFAEARAQQLAALQAAIDALPTAEAVQAMDTTAETYAETYAGYKADTAAAQALLTAYKATLTEAQLADLEAILGAPGEAPADENPGTAPAVEGEPVEGEAPAEGAPAEGELLTEAASQPTRLVKLNDLTAYFADKRFEAMVRELQAAVATLPTAETLAAMTMDSDEYLAAKTQYNAAWTTLQSLYAQMTEADKTRFEADERVLAALQAMNDLFTYFENNEIPHIQTAIDGMPDPYWTGFLAELLYSDTDNSASMYDLPTGETPAEAPAAGEAPAEAPTGETPAEAPAGETVGETPATDAIDPVAAEAKFLANLQEVYDGLGLILDPDDPRAAGDELFAELWAALGDVQPRTVFLTHDAVDTEAGQAYLGEKLGAQENAETTRLEKYNALLGIMQGISGIQAMTSYASLNGDLARISEFKVESIVDGTAPLDADNNPGNDAAPDNKIVRTFDDITYTLSATTTPYATGDTFSAAKAKFEFVLPCTSDEAEFNTAAMGWMMAGGAYQWAITNETRNVGGVDKACQVLTCWRDIPQNEISHVSIPGTFTVNVTLKVKSMKNGDIVQPVFSAALEHNTWSDTVCPTTGHVQEKMTATLDPVRVTAVPKYNIGIAPYINYKGTFDFSTGSTTLAANRGKGTFTGRAEAWGVNVSLYNDNASKGFKGIELPNGSDITFSIDVSSIYRPDSGGTITAEQLAAAGYAPLLWSYEGLCELPTQKDGRILNTPYKTAYYTAPLNRYTENGTISIDACYDGGDWYAVQTGSKINVTIKDYHIDMSSLPKRNAADGADRSGYGEYIGIFSAGEFWILQPFNVANSTNTSPVYDIVNAYGSGTFSMTVKETDLKITGLSGQTQQDSAGTNSAQIKKNDDIQSDTIYVSTPGTMSQIIAYTSNDTGYVDINGREDCYGNGRDATYVGRTGIYLRSTISWLPNNEEDNKPRYFTSLTKFDASAIELTGNNSLPASVYGLTPRTLYAVRKAGSTQNWTNDAEMKAATEDDLMFYATLADIPVGDVCVGALTIWQGEFTGDLGSQTGYSAFLGANIKNDQGLVGNVYMITQTSRLWTKDTLDMANDGAGIELVDLPSWLDPTTKLSDFPNPTASIVPNYTKESYDDNGNALGTHTGSNNLGDSLLIVGYTATITKHEEQKAGGTAALNYRDGNDKQTYDLDASQRIADFVLQPGTAMNASVPGGQTTTVTIQDTLPAGLKYKPGSSYLGGYYIQTSAAGGTQGQIVENNAANNPAYGTEYTGGATPAYPTPALKEPDRVINNANGTQTLIWIIENAVVGAPMAAIHYSCIIGTPGVEATDVPTGTSNFGNTVGIKTTEDTREWTVPNGNKALEGITVVRNTASSFAKIAKNALIEPDGTAGYTIFNGNNSASPINPLRFMDTMPYNGDSRGSSFSGTYSISDWKIDTTLMGTSTLQLYYTYDTAYREKLIDDVTDGEITANWTLAGIDAAGKATMPNDGGGNPPVAWALLGTQAGNSTIKVELDMKLAPTSPQIGDKYTNAVSIPGNSTTTEVGIVRRTLEGVTWMDSNYNGIRESSETMLSGVKATLLKLKDGAEPALESSYEVYTPTINGVPTPMIVNTGSQRDVISGATTNYEAGRYKFTTLPAGTFAVRFESGSASIATYRASPANVNDPATGDSSNDSDGLPTYNTTGTVRDSLQQTFIPNIVMPAAADMSVSLYERKFQDSGFDILRTNVTVSKAVSGNAGDRTKDFSFTVTIRDGSNTAVANTSFDCAGGVLAGVTGVTAPSTTTVTTNASGQATVTLKHGQTLTIKDLPTTYDVQIAETSPVNDGYSTNYTYKVASTVVNNNVAGLDTGVKELNVSKHLTDGTIEPQSAAFTNTRTITVPTGILLDIWPYLLIVAAAIGVGAWLLVSKRRKNARKRDGDDWK